VNDDDDAAAARQAWYEAKYQLIDVVGCQIENDGVIKQIIFWIGRIAVPWDPCGPFTRSWWQREILAFSIAVQRCDVDQFHHKGRVAWRFM
jgi:hypothetical protein